ncbi:hypothetical protein HF086_015980 [Spodoptera exigua]|uniref:Uncharacterized protein n=1 Tax=Spodoptera exigua TaxID=7107 RepID=A0A922M9Z8_SPOEX|nr:hypothetical protein HF086_015980 [Spodoptera exigua]
MLGSLLFVFAFSVFSLSAEALLIDDLKQKYVDSILQCSQQYPLDRADAELLQNKVMPDKESTKCLFACVYKVTGVMSDQGELSVEGVNALSQKYLADDPEKLKKSEEFTEACRTVNDAPVSDGARGCDRAALIFKCTIEKSPDEIDMWNFLVVFLAICSCVYMNAKGEYDIDHAYKVAEMMKNGDEKRLVNAKKMADLCVKVNEQSVSDGEKGCDRAAMIFKCTVENAPKFGFKL